MNYTTGLSKSLVASVVALALVFPYVLDWMIFISNQKYCSVIASHSKCIIFTSAYTLDSRTPPQLTNQLQHRLQDSNAYPGPTYEPLTAVALSETMKLTLCIMCIYISGSTAGVPQNGKHPSLVESFSRLVSSLRHGSRRAAIPAMLYTVAASAQATGASHLQLLPYLMMSQLKLFFTPLFGIILLRQTVGIRHWACLGTMAAGMVVVQSAVVGPAVQQDSEKVTQNPALGASAMVVAGVCVALSGVYMEKLLKETDSFLVRNAQLAAQSGALSVVGLLWKLGFHPGLFFQGYRPLTWVYIGIQTLGGFIVAWCVLVSSTVAKNYAQGLGFITATLVSLILSSSRISHQVSALDQVPCETLADDFALRYTLEWLWCWEASSGRYG